MWIRILGGSDFGSDLQPLARAPGAQAHNAHILWHIASRTNHQKQDRPRIRFRNGGRPGAAAVPKSGPGSVLFLVICSGCYVP